jgi:hypothetical protein
VPSGLCFGKKLREGDWRNITNLKFIDSAMVARTDHQISKKDSFEAIHLLCVQTLEKNKHILGSDGVRQLNRVNEAFISYSSTMNVYSVMTEIGTLDKDKQNNPEQYCMKKKGKIFFF